MIGIRKHLDPGERVLLRHPPVWVVVVAAALVAGLAAMPPIMDMSRDAIRAPELGITVAAHAVIGMALMLVVFLFGRWRVAVTGRRVLVRRWLPGGPVEAMPRDRIEAASCVDRTLFVHGEGRVISALCLPLFAGPLLKLIDPLYDNLKLRTPGLRKRLVPGERVVLRERRSTASILSWTAMPALPLLFMFLVLSHPDILNAWLDLLPGILSILALLLFVLLFQFSFDISWIGLFFDHWRVAVTDRRILVRRGILGTRHDEMARDDIESVRYDPAARRLFIAGGGDEIEIRCFDDEAERIRRALGSELAEVRA